MSWESGLKVSGGEGVGLKGDGLWSQGRFKLKWQFSFAQDTIQASTPPPVSDSGHVCMCVCVCVMYFLPPYKENVQYHFYIKKSPKVPFSSLRLRLRLGWSASKLNESLSQCVKRSHNDRNTIVCVCVCAGRNSWHTVYHCNCDHSNRSLHYRTLFHFTFNISFYLCMNTFMKPNPCVSLILYRLFFFLQVCGCFRLRVLFLAESIWTRCALLLLMPIHLKVWHGSALSSV